MATIRIDLASEDQASRNVLSLRRQITDLNAKIAENNSRVAQGTAEERRKVAETNRGIRAESQLLRVQQQRQAIALAGLRQETGLLAQNRRQTELLTRITRGLGGAFGAVAGVGLAATLLDVGRQSIQASVRVEGFRNSLTALYGDAQVADRVLEGLQEAARLPGITFEGAVQGAIRLKTVQIEGSRAQQILMEFGNAAALSGASAEEMGRALVGLTQTVARGQIEQDNLNQILENVPLIGNAIREAFGSIDAETIRDVLESAGNDVNDFVDILTNQLAEGARASADTAANAFSNLGNATFELSAAIGDRLLPAFQSGAEGLTAFFGRLTDYITDTDDTTAAVNSFRSALQDADTALERRDAIDARIDYLETFKQRLFDAANELDRFDSRLAGIQGQIDETNERIQTLTDIREGRITTADLVRDLEALIDTYSERAAEETRLEQVALQTHRAQSEVAKARLIDIRNEKAELADQIEEYQNYIKVSQEGGEAAEQAHARATEGTETTTQSTKDLVTEVQRLTQIYNDLATNVQQANEQFDLVEQSGFADFYRLVRGEIEAYGGAVDTVIPSVTDAEQEQQAFNAAVQSGIDATKEIVGDPLADYIDGLGLTSDAADRATSGITDTSEATKELTADIDNANERLRDFDIALERPIVTIPRLASAMQAFAGTAPEVDKVDEAVKQTTRSVDELLDNIRAEGTGISAFESFVLSAEAQFEGLAEDTVPRVTRDIVDAFVNIAEGDDINDAFGRLGERAGYTLIDELSEVLSGQLSTAVIGQLQGVSAAGIGSQLVGAASALAAPVGIFAASVAAFALIGEGLSRLVPGVEETRIEPITPADILLAGGQIANLPVQLDIGAIGEGLDLSGGVDTSALLESFGFPTGGGTGPNPFRSGSLVRGTQALAEATGTDRQAIEDVARDQYGADDYAAEVAAATGEALEGSVDIPDLDTVFQFTGAQRQALAPLETAVSEAEEFIQDFIDEDSTPEEVQAAYQRLTAAEQALYNQQITFIQNATGITEAARDEAERVAGALFDREIRSANQDLVGALEDIGFELVNALTFTSGILSGSAIAIRRIPEMVEEAVAETEPEPEPLREEFRFTGAQRSRLETLEGDVAEAEDTLNRLRSDDTATQQQLTEAYNNLIAAEQALFDQEIAFINAGADVFTGSALEEARTQAGQRFRGEIFDANVDLTRGLENLGLQLTTTITDWFMILTGAQLTVEAIPDPEVPETPDTPTPLRERHRFSQAEQARLDILENDVRAAEDAVGLLDESSTEAEVTEAYNNLANAEQALYQQKLDFIDGATGITETARRDARELAEGIFGREIFDANQRLVRSLGEIGLQLVTMFDATTGILMGTALATQQIAQETVDAGTQDDGIGNNLLQNAIARARFQLTGATTEQGFETARQDLIRAVNAYYDAEETRINMLMVSEEELQDLREDNDLARDQALRRATNATNTFAEQRIRTEEQEAEERRRIAERTQAEIEGLRDDAAENERDRLADLADLAVEHQQRLTSIEEDGIRARQDLQRDANRSREDIEREFQDDFREIHRQRVFGEISDEEAARQTQELGRQRLEDLRELGIRTERRQEDLDIREERAIGDAQGRFGRSEQEIIFEAEQQALAITDALTPLLAQQAGDPIAELRSETAMTESATALMEATTAETASATEMTRAETAVTEAGTALLQSEATEAFSTTTDTFSETVDTFREGVDGLLTVPGLIENAFGVVSTQLTDIFTLTTTIAQRLLIPTAPTPPAFVVEGARNAAAPTGGQQAPVEVVVNVQNSDVILDNQKVGQVIGDTIVRQGANRRNLLGRND